MDTEKKRIAKSPVKPAVKKATPKKVAAQAPAKKAAKTKIVLDKSNGNNLETIRFQLRYHTVYGQTIFITGNHPLLGDGDLQKAIPLQYQNDDLWAVTIDFGSIGLLQELQYQYILQNADGSNSLDAGNDKIIEPKHWNCSHLISIDSWNFGGYFENAFYTEPFANVLLKANRTLIAQSKPKTITHVFKVKTPLLPKGQTVCLLGSSKGLNKWETGKPILLSRKEDEAYYSVSLDLSKEIFPMAYKYGIYDTVTKQFLQFEQGNNRVLYDINLPGQQSLIHDGFMVLPNLNWKGAGVAIPVFSLRTEKSLGVGEFTDLKVLVDWAKHVGLKMIQILPINDTTATHTWTDSYPYAAISAFALHPMFLNLDLLADKKTKPSLDRIKREHAGLNDLDEVDYETVNQIKLEFIREVFVSQKSSFQKNADFCSLF